jgi:hypothetical protein
MFSELIHHRLTHHLRRTFPIGGRSLHLIGAVTAAASLWAGGRNQADAQNLTPSNVFMSAYHAPFVGGVLVAETRANAFTAITDGITAGGNGLDTFNLDGLGIVKDFVGFEYASPQRFDTITVNLGNQFSDGGDWDSKPKVYILKNRTLTGDQVEPNLSPNWVELPGAVENSGHVFSPTAQFGQGPIVRFDLTAIPAAQRSGWGWAIGGVDGSSVNDGGWNFISVNEAFATGAPATAPAFSPPATPVPTNVLSNRFISLARSAGSSGFGLIDDNRGQGFAALTNGILDRNAGIGLGNDGFETDTFGGDPTGVVNDFVGLQYGAAYQFNTLKVELGKQYSFGGDWQSKPKIYILKNPVDTGSTRPETDPTNWLEVTGAVETTGHAFNMLGQNGAGGTINFDLSAIPADQRSGYGWAIGGVDGNQDGGGGGNFVSVTEVSATGTLIPGPYEIRLEVNTTNGATRLLNPTPFNIPLDLYKVTSAHGSLNPAGWNRLETPAGNPAGFPSGDGTGNGWEELGTASDQAVAEGYLQNSSTLERNSSATLGNLFSVGDMQDLAFRYRAPDGVFYDAIVQYVTSTAVFGDYNQNGVVDAADYTLWRNNFGSPTSLPNDPSPGVGQDDYTRWKQNFGQTGGGAGSIAAPSPIPEPTTFALLGTGMIFGLCRRRRRPSMRRNATGSKNTRLQSIASALLLLVVVSAAPANTTDDRFYRLGDDPLEGASAGVVLGAGAGNVAPGNTLDSQGPSGKNAFIDIQVPAGSTPRYISVADRPGAGATLGAVFDGPGSGDYLRTPVSLNVPSSTWDNTTFFPPATPFGLNYETILSHGIQLWAKPNSATQGVRQDLILDTAQHGVFITATNHWGLQYVDAFVNINQAVNIDSGVPVAFNAWTHVMEIAGQNDPDDGHSNRGRALLINGVAVAASDTFYGGDTSALSIGASQNGASNFYNGVLDDVSLFFWGNNSRQTNGGAGPNGMDWGNLDLSVDNDWIASQLAALGVTDAADVNLDGSVNSNDVTAFLPDWRKVRRVDGVQVGDWTSRQNGDLNYDGIVDLKDAYILHQGLIGAGSAAGLDFSLLGSSLPEPTGAALAAIGMLFVASGTGRRKGRSGDRKRAASTAREVAKDIATRRLR